jgi:hypothetical protein
MRGYRGELVERTAGTFADRGPAVDAVKVFENEVPGFSVFPFALDEKTGSKSVSPNEIHRDVGVLRGFGVKPLFLAKKAESLGVDVQNSLDRG